MIDLKKIIKSIAGGSTATVIYIIISFILDKWMGAKISNAVSLIIGAICNFYMQQLVFLNTSNITLHHSWKFLISEFLVLGSSQYGVSYLLDKKNYIETKFKKIKLYDKYYNTVIRVFIACLAFIFISFPIRNYWVFI